MDYHYIVMADIVKSSNFSVEVIHKPFGDLVASCNKEFSDHILSPYTITLGDEFQGVADSIQSAVESIIFMEEECINKQLKFKLRFIVYYGEITTQLNPVTAHGMLGEGLTQARKKLTQVKKNKRRFYFDLSDKRLSVLLERLFAVMQGIIRGWSPKDYLLIKDMIFNKNNQEVAELYRKNRTQIWKRRKNLLVSEYDTLKAAIFDEIKKVT